MEMHTDLIIYSGLSTLVTNVFAVKLEPSLFLDASLCLPHSPLCGIYCNVLNYGLDVYLFAAIFTLATKQDWLFFENRIY